MVEATTGIIHAEVDRDALQNELLAEAQKILEGWDGYKIEKEDKERGLIAKSFPCGEGFTGLIIKFISKRLTIEKMREMYENREEHMKKMGGGKDAKMTMKRLPDQ